MTRYIAVGTVSDFNVGDEVTGIEESHARELVEAGVIREATKDDILPDAKPKSKTETKGEK